MVEPGLVGGVTLELVGVGVGVGPLAGQSAVKAVDIAVALETTGGLVWCVKRLSQVIQ